MTVTLRTLVLTAALVVTGAAGGIVLLVRSADGGEPAAPSLAPGVPRFVSAAELVALGERRPVHWAGEQPPRRLEITQTAAGTYVRYLPAGTAVGAEIRTLTIATYELDRAWAIAQEAAGNPDARQERLADGRVAIWRTSRPTSVYLAEPGSDLLVEVFDPRAATARELSRSGRVTVVPRG